MSYTKEQVLSLIFDARRYYSQNRLDPERFDGWEWMVNSEAKQPIPVYYPLWRAVDFFYKEGVMYVNKVGTMSQRISEYEKSIISSHTTSSQFEDKGWMFITIGYDDKIITPSKMLWAVEKIKKIGKMKYTFFRYVHEKFRKDDKGVVYEHHHTHILIRTAAYKSDFIDQAFRFLSPLINGQKNYIDVKLPKDKVGNFTSKLKYVEGDKQQTKLECVALDKIWRKENGLEEILFSPT